jgi:hypothetical protein
VLDPNVVVNDTRKLIRIVGINIDPRCEWCSSSTPSACRPPRGTPQRRKSSTSILPFGVASTA